MNKIFFLLPIIFSVCIVFAQEKSYTTKRTATAPIIDGSLNDKAWNAVSWGKDFVQASPKKGDKPSQSTQFKILYDAANMYVAIRCFDNPDSITKIPVPRDGFSGDWVEIELNCNEDTSTAHSFTVTAYGTRADEFIAKGGALWDSKWNPQWETKTAIDRSGWTAEMKIPFNQFTHNGSFTKVWGLQFTRRMVKGGERSAWKLLPDIESTWINNYGVLHGIENITASQLKAKAVYNDNKLYSIAELQNDFNVIKKILEGTYPSLYRFYSKAVMDKFIHNTYQSINKPMTELEYYKLLAPLFDKIGDGHTKFYMSYDYQNLSAVSIKKLPLQLYITDQQAYILQNYSEEATLIPGTKILSINGKPFSEILTDLMSYLTSDGYNATKKYNNIGQRFGYLYSLLDTGSEDIILETIAAGGKKIEEVKVARLCDKDITKNRTARYPASQRNFELSFPVTNAALLTVKTFTDDRAFMKFFDTSFAAIKQKNIPNVIIDLRNNGGGNDYNGAYLFSYLTSKPFKYYSRFETAVSADPHSVDSIPCCISHEDLNFLNEISVPDSAGVKVIRNYKASRQKDPALLHQPAENNFKGNVYVLINGGSFSCSSEFCSVADFNSNAIFVGEETGGGYYGNTSNMFRDIILPNTNLRLSIAFIKYLSAVEGSTAEIGRGIMPDYPVKPTALDIKNGVDKELKFTLELINGKK
ncbi:hypothetical protein FAM09_16155 [Niastella caeni]|uniref:Tail specific protease domain-containing protein n=1 Tax=Niastella caeni TaxID=2569763 RepID=A0A4S8HT66_9BACT|nr:carbohydrate binding family 9 domain-containing protein [Niastella caeni]THU38211.1 hypothetical protein FAM09_16155 [Niastella caeni]